MCCKAIFPIFAVLIWIGNAQAGPLASLQACLAQNSIESTPLEQNGIVRGAEPTIVCRDDLAVQLWGDLYAYSRDRVFNWRDSENRTVQAMRIGNNPDGSVCNRVVYDANGRPPTENHYWCVISFDLAPSILQNLR